MGIESITFDARQVHICTLNDIGTSHFVAPFAALVFAPDERARVRVLQASHELIRCGCIEFCCIGIYSESLHDDLDRSIEADSDFDVVTTWHNNNLDGCEYFLYGAGGQQLSLYAFISNQPDALSALMSTLNKD